MTIEASPVASAISMTNWVCGSTVTTSPLTNPLYPASNLTSGMRSKRWRSSTGNGNTYVGVDIGTAQFPTVVSFIDVNFSFPYSNGFTIYLIGAGDPGFTTSRIVYQFPIYDVSAGNRVLTYYLSLSTTPDLGTPGARRYWAFQLNDGVQAWGLDYSEIGVFWLGTYADIEVNQRAKIQLSDSSIRAKAYGGAEYVDPYPVGASLDLAIENLSQAEVYALRRSAASGFTRHALIDIHAYSTDYVSIRPYSAYYGKFSDKGGLNIALEAATRNSLDIQFSEARG